MTDAPEATVDANLVISALADQVRTLSLENALLKARLAAPAE